MRLSKALFVFAVIVFSSGIAVRVCAQGVGQGWSRQFGVANAFTQALGLSATPDAVYVVGATSGSLPGQSSLGVVDAYIRKYDVAGNEVWTRQFGTPSEDAATAVSLTATNVYVAGRTSGALPGQTSSGYHDVYVRKYDVNGNELWTRQFGSPGEEMGNQLFFEDRL